MGWLVGSQACTAKPSQKAHSVLLKKKKKNTALCFLLRFANLPLSDLPSRARAQTPNPTKEGLSLSGSGGVRRCGRLDREPATARWRAASSCRSSPPGCRDRQAASALKDLIRLEPLLRSSPVLRYVTGYSSDARWFMCWRGSSRKKSS